MPTYAMLSTLGPGGWATLRETPDRLREVTDEVESMGLKVVAQYALMGQWDFLNIIEAPDEAAMARVADRVGRTGHDADDDHAGDPDRDADRSAARPVAGSGRALHPPHVVGAAALLANVVEHEDRRQH